MLLKYQMYCTILFLKKCCLISDWLMSQPVMVIYRRVYHIYTWKDTHQYHPWFLRWVVEKSSTIIISSFNSLNTHFKAHTYNQATISLYSTVGICLLSPNEKGVLSILFLSVHTISTKQILSWHLFSGTTFAYDTYFLFYAKSLNG